ncbi:MAG: slipin family protein [Patescibacteria group bacterium]|nr:slipin family protein [Patescibacteria group bacterium]
MFFYAFIAIIALLVVFIKQVDQYEQGLVFTLGKYSYTAQPGWRIIIPVFQSMTKVDIRTKAVDVPEQEAMTKDNIPANINAVIYYRVTNSEKAILEVENFYYAISQMAQTTMRNIVGETELDELLANRESISKKIKDIIDNASDNWGLTVESVELKDVVLPGDMKRTMAKQAEAEREKRAVIIKAEGEKIAADNLAAAASTLASSDGALHLRTLQTLNDVSSDQSNTIIFATPIEVLSGFAKLGQK